MVRLVKKKLGRLLVERRVITEEQLKEALLLQKEEGIFLGECLVKLGYTTEEDIVSCLCIQYGFPYLSLASYDIDPDLIKIVPEATARRYHLVPLDKIGKMITIAMADPLDRAAIEHVETITGCKVELFVSTGTEIKEVIDRHFGKKGKEIGEEEALKKMNFHHLKDGESADKES